MQGPRGRQGFPGLAGEAGAKGQKVQMKLTPIIWNPLSGVLYTADLMPICRETQEPVHRALLACHVPLDHPSLAVYL